MNEEKAEWALWPKRGGQTHARFWAPTKRIPGRIGCLGRPSTTECGLGVLQGREFGSGVFKSRCQGISMRGD